MIQSLRKTHRWTFFGLSLALPAVFAGGLLLRKPPAPSSPVSQWKAQMASMPEPAVVPLEKAK